MGLWNQTGGKGLAGDEMGEREKRKERKGRKERRREW